MFEAGIGGRYDPVRLVGARVTCVTSVDYEHVELLGHSLQLIASDKSDACASGGTIIYGENLRDLRPHLIEYNRYRAITSLFIRDQIGIAGKSASASGQRFDFDFGGHAFRSLEMRLLGSFQFNNASIAVTLFLLWLQRTRPGDDAGKIEAAVRSGLRDVNWPGRLEVIRQDPLTVIDVGHTPDGIRQSLASLKAIYGADGWILVTGVSRDKDTDEIVERLGAVVRHHHLHQRASQRRRSGSHRRRGAHGQSGCDRSDCRDHRGRGRLSQTLAAAMQRKIYVAGGLFLAVEYAVVARGGRARGFGVFLTSHPSSPGEGGDPGRRGPWR